MIQMLILIVAFIVGIVISLCIFLSRVRKGEGCLFVRELGETLRKLGIE